MPVHLRSDYPIPYVKLPKGETAKGLKYSINQEKHLKVFLSDGEVPIDNSASERSIRTFCVGKNYVLNQVMCY